MTKHKCTHCGKCCIAVSFALTGKPGEESWLLYHGFQIVRGDGPTLARIHIVCMHLMQNKGGKSRCKIYAKRPQVCKDYRCALPSGSHRTTQNGGGK